jgi:hypothetical protein
LVVGDVVGAVVVGVKDGEVVGTSVLGAFVGGKEGISVGAGVGMLGA